MSRRIFGSGEYLVKDIACNEVFTPEDFTDEHRQIGKTAEQFVINEIWPINDEIEAKNFELVTAQLRKCGDLGLLMIDAPEEHGGLELDKVTSMLVNEKFAYAKSFGLAFMCHTGIGMLPLIFYGTPRQKEKYLGNLMSGDWAASYCLTEPGSGSDALGAKSTAVLSENGTHFILNGTKQFITNAGFAHLFTIFAKVDKRYFTGFLVERTFAGLEFGPEEKKMGMRGTSTRQVIMNNVKVPVENLLGEVGKGHKIAFNVLNLGRFKLGAACTGQIKYALEEGARYANERKQFAQPIAVFGAIREKLADVTAMAFASESALYRLAGMIDDRVAAIPKNTDDYYTLYQKGIEEYAAECAIVKVFCTELAAEAIDEMLQIHGGYGYIAEYAIEQLYRDERVQRIWEGTNEVNRLLIPGTFMKKGVNTQAPELQTMAGENSFSTETALLQEMKTRYAELSTCVTDKVAEKSIAEQEILLTLADMAIQIFALESAALRGKKAIATASSVKQGQYLAVVKVCAFKARQKFNNAAEKCGAYLELEGMFHAIAPVNAHGLLAAKRILADAVSQAEKYIF